MKQKINHYFPQFPRITPLVVIALVSILLGMWIWITRDSWHYGRGLHFQKGIGSAVGVIGYTLFSISLFLSSRWKKLEDWIGGLDQVYNLHHKMGIWGFYLLLVHPWIHAMKWIPHRFDRFFLFIFPLHHRLSVDLGAIAFWLMVFIIGVTILKLLPYDKWKLIHKFMTLVFIFASLHFILSRKRFDPTFASLALLFIPMGLGIFGIIYKQIWLPFSFRNSKYQITHTKKINDNVIMITLEPENQPLVYTPGQFVFFSFLGNLSREQHPFTICNTKGSSISILAKIRGDFTTALYHKVALGDLAYLEGPYGRFDYTQGLKNQIWIAGGIGIAPFLAWCETLTNWEGKIDLFYCFHREIDGCFLKEFQRMQKEAPHFHLHLFCSEKNQRLSIKKIQDVEGNLQGKDIFMCGPRRLTHPFIKELKQAGVRRKNIRFEDFEFF